LWLAGARDFSLRIREFSTLKSLCPYDWFNLLHFCSSCGSLTLCARAYAGNGTLTFEKVEKTLQRLVKEIKDEAKQWVSAGAKQLAKIVATMSSKQFFSFALI
jgi:hypothetical protein